MVLPQRRNLTTALLCATYQNIEDFRGYKKMYFEVIHKRKKMLFVSVKGRMKTLEACLRQAER
jgi:hypothetical protein